MVNYNIDDNGVLKIYYNNEILCEISGCSNNTTQEIEEIISIEVGNQIETLQNEIGYMNRKMKVCTYGEEELRELAYLENKLKDLRRYLNEK